MNSPEMWQEASDVVQRIRRNERLIRLLVLNGFIGALVPLATIGALHTELTRRHFQLCFGILGVAVFALLYAVVLLWSNRQSFRRLIELDEVRSELARELAGKQVRGSNGLDD